MDDSRQPSQGEAGTSLAELLVVIVLFSVVGLITTTGIVRGFNAQLDATNVAETLDGMRIATQRVRDFVREADEVCASSTQSQLVLWTDDNEDGAVQDTEKDIFELDTTTTPPVFQRRVPSGGETQIIRDDILNGAIFIFDNNDSDSDGDGIRNADEQPASLQCTDGTAVDDSLSRIRSVQVQFTVDHPDPAQPDLATSTSVRIRNADLLEEPNTAPVAAFTVDCDATSLSCTFDASASTDTDGSIANYIWEFGDFTGDAGVTVTHTYAASDTYDVTLLVVDNDGAVGDTITQQASTGVTTGNPPAVADFDLVNCTGGLICTFDASASSDDSGIAQYEWDFGDGTTATGTTATIDHTFASGGTYAVTLTVVANDADQDDFVKSVTVGTNVIRVESIGSTVTPKPSSYDVLYTIQLGRTTGGAPGAGITISVELTGGKSRTDSCSTDASGACSVEVKSVKDTDVESLEVTNISDTTSTYTYDPSQDVVDQVVVDSSNSRTLYKDGVEVSP